MRPSGSGTLQIASVRQSYTCVCPLGVAFVSASFLWVAIGVSAGSSLAHGKWRGRQAALVGAGVAHVTCRRCLIS